MYQISNKHCPVSTGPATVKFQSLQSIAFSMQLISCVQSTSPLWTSAGSVTPVCPGHSEQKYLCTGKDRAVDRQMPIVSPTEASAMANSR